LETNSGSVFQPCFKIGPGDLYLKVSKGRIPELLWV
jgi:hypothetical protein